jgi:alpha-tubulin suppressor-like RCC1 family protein
MNRRALLIPLVLTVNACTDHLPTGPASEAQFDIADAAHDYKAGFYWLPPLVKAASYDGVFDAALTPTVEICELVENACGSMIATYTTAAGPGGELVRVSVAEEHYHVNWHTDQFGLNTTTFYRVSVRGGIRNMLLGYADIQPVSNGSGLKNVDTGEYIGLVDGRTLPIKFRIQSGIVGAVDVQPLEATADPGGTRQFVAVVRDLHDNIMSADVTWSSSDEAVAIVDEHGLATAVADGQAIITATSQKVSGSAVLTVEGGVVVVSSGRAHACALGTDGRAFCWGRNEHAQLGDGTLSDRRRPTPVATDQRFVTIATGSFHSCALTEAGAAYCWGLNQNGEVGDGTRVRRTTPVAVLGGLAFVSIATGSNNTCAITTDQRAYCWGQGSFGAVGNGSSAAFVMTPQPVAGGHAFAMISSALQYTCGVTTSGQGFCWGNGSAGRLGNGSTAHRFTPHPVSGGLMFTTVETGDAHACGITTANVAYCWGAGAFGRLGTGSTNSTFTPLPVAGGHLFAQISPGGLHTCGVTVAGKGYCWGGNIDGNLGDGGGFSRTSPSAVIGNHTWASISASGQYSSGAGSSTFVFTCGVTVENQVLCWGSNFFGQLGDGSGGIARGTPAPVAEFP